MKKAILAILLIIAISHVENWYLDHRGDAATRKGADSFDELPEASPAYAAGDVDALNALAARVSKGKSQAEALAELWHVTPDELEKPVNLFGQDEGVRP